MKGRWAKNEEVVSENGIYDKLTANKRRISLCGLKIVPSAHYLSSICRGNLFGILRIQTVSLNCSSFYNLTLTIKSDFVFFSSDKCYECLYLYVNRKLIQNI